MKIIALEEHFVTSDVARAWATLDPQHRDLAFKPSTEGDSARKLEDLGEGRLAAMREAGVDVQVLSLTAPGVQCLPPDEAVALQVASNDVLAEAVRAHPGHFQGLATLATPVPHAAAKELERAVTKLGLNGAMLFGRTRERNVDDASFWPILETAAALRAPVYLHPQSPQPGVRAACYEGLGRELDMGLATFGLGWHYETGVQLIRLLLSGAFDRFPDLQVVVGHWGEVVLFFIERLELLARQAKLERPIADYFRTNVWVTASGMLSPRYMRWAIEVVGVKRVMFSTDHPFVPIDPGRARAFLEQAELGEDDRQRVAHGNWEALCAGIRR